MANVNGESNIVGALLGLHAQTSLHPGAGTSMGTVDLPVQRERHTQWPNMGGSAIKGVLREACREFVAELPNDQVENEGFSDDVLDDHGKFESRSSDANNRSGRSRADYANRVAWLFGPPKGTNEFAGALSITDARLAAFPVRSLKGVFAWVSCPAALSRLKRDAELAGYADFPSLDQVSKISRGTNGELPAVAADSSPCLVDGKNAQGHDCQQVVLEEFDFTRTTGDPTAIAEWIAKNLLPSRAEYSSTRQQFVNHFLVLSDDDFTHFARHATEVVARIALDYETKTVKKGALFYQEFLPPETLLYSVVLANRTRAAHGKAPGVIKLTTPKDVLSTLAETLSSAPFLQFGGDETTGKGLCGVHLTEGRPTAR